MKNLLVRHALGRYPVAIGGGLGERLALWLKRERLGQRLVMVTHPEVLELHGRGLLATLQKYHFEVIVFTIPGGEENKSLTRAEDLYAEFSRALVERQTPVLAMGGGVIGDLGGFVAATFMRGLPLVHLPTTLLAQVDSSLGGKTAVNCGSLKNQVGVFYAPRAVFSDVATLKTLSPAELANGLAEIIKSAVIREPYLFNLLERRMEKIQSREPRLLEEVVYRAAAVKAAVVARDEREAGIRRLLNLGHTVGHAVETVTNFRISHGEAVAMGLVAAGRLANRLRLFRTQDLDRLLHLLILAGLPAELPPLDLAALLEAMQHDKKLVRGRLKFILPLRIGQVVEREVDPVLVAEVLSET